MSLLIVQCNDFENWTQSNPILKNSEISVTRDKITNEIEAIKIGDGNTPWNNLDSIGNNYLQNILGTGEIL